MNGTMMKRWKERLADKRFEQPDGTRVRALREGEIRAMCKALNDNSTDAKTAQALIDMLDDSQPVFVLPEQALKGLNWLRNTVFDMKGNVRRTRLEIEGRPYIIDTLRACIAESESLTYRSRCYTVAGLINTREDMGRYARPHWAPVYKLTTPDGKDSVRYAAVAWQSGSSFFF